MDECIYYCKAFNQHVQNSIHTRDFETSRLPLRCAGYIYPISSLYRLVVPEKLTKQARPNSPDLVPA